MSDDEVKMIAKRAYWMYLEGWNFMDIKKFTGISVPRIRKQFKRADINSSYMFQPKQIKKEP